MKHLRMFCLVIVLSFSVGMMAQNKPAPAASPVLHVQAAPPPPPTVAVIIDRQITQLEKQVVDAAEAMPEDKFNFSPESLNLAGSDYKGVRTFALEVRHVATANYAFWCPLTGDPLPAGIKGPNGPEDMKTKAEIVKFLKDSFVLGHKAAATLTPQNLTEMVKTFRGDQPRLAQATFAIEHANDHYGQMVEYLRMNGIVPPASRAQN